MNGHLVIDLGGLHKPEDGDVTFTQQFGAKYGMENMTEYAPQTHTIAPMPAAQPIASPARCP